jgi:hypothetical protein
LILRNQLVEFAWGLCNSKKTFLWIIRPDLVKGDSAILPPEFLEETQERGLMASWCPQEQVLKHPSSGGFISHTWGGIQQLKACPVECQWFVGHFSRSNKPPANSLALNGVFAGGLTIIQNEMKWRM